VNPNTGQFEPLRDLTATDLKQDKLRELDFFRGLMGQMGTDAAGLVRPDGTPVPPHWPIFNENEIVQVKGWNFKVGHIGESTLVLESHGPMIVGEDTNR